MTKFFRGALLGPPGSGKGSISDLIIEKFDIVHVSAGDIFRQSIAGKTALGSQVQKYMEEGRLVPDVLVVKIIFERLKELADKNWLCDGFPRTEVQAQKFWMKYPLDLVINLKVPVEEIINRVKGRLVHVPSGRVYNTDFKPPKEAGKDDVTGEPLLKRPDDEPEAVLRRLKLYDEMTLPLLQFYREKGILKEFEGTSSQKLYEEVEKVLKNYMTLKS